MDHYTNLLLEWESRRQRGENADVELLCPDNAALQHKLAETIQLLEQFDSLMSPSQPAASADQPVPDHIGKYEVRRVIAIGGMGVVYEGWDPVLAHTVAIKIIKPKPHHDPVLAKRAIALFLREGQLLAKFGRKSIVAALEAGEQNGIPYLVMDYLPGGNLKDQRQRLTEAGSKAIVPLMEKVARAVQDAHDEGVLHRDLKPGNVLLDAKSNPFIADFGLGAIQVSENREASNGNGTINSHGVTITCVGGTPGYMAPEQYDHVSGPPGKPADVWALGIILYELLMGRLPFVETSKTTFYEQTTQAPTPPLPGVPKALAAVVHRCLEKKPAMRFQSAGELADELRRLDQPTRRQALRAGAAASLAAGIGLGWWNWRSKPDPEIDGYTNPQAIREALKRLEKGEAVTLVSPGQLPNYRFGLRPGLTNGQVYVHEGYVRAHGSGPCLVELLPRLPPGAWAFEARVRHTNAVTPTSQVGIYTAHSQRRTQWGTQHVFVALQFADHVGATRNTHVAGLANVDLHYLGDEPDKPLYPRNKSPFSPYRLRGAVPGLRLDVRETQFRATCEDSLVAQFGAEQLEDFRNSLVKPPKPVPRVEVEFNPFAGLGLLVRDGELAVEEATVSPL